MASSNLSGLDFLKNASIRVGDGVVQYVKDAMPTTTSTISGAKSTIQEFNSKMHTTASDILPKIKQLKGQMNVRSLMNWFTSKEDEYNSMVGEGAGFGEWDDGTSDVDIADAQISETKASANQISGAIVESIHKSVESQIAMSSNILASLDKQSATIAAGFENTNNTLNKILEVLTKNTAALIETASFSKDNPSNDMLKDGKFNLSSYKKIIKSNFANSEVGAYSSMAQSMMAMMFAGGKLSPDMVTSMLIQGAVSKFAPKLDKNIRALDDAVSDVILGSLVRLGNSKNSGGLRGALAEIFGVDGQRKTADTEISTLSLKSVPFDTVTKEAITNAIPGYLRKILVAVGGADEIYDYRSRSFKTRRAIQKEFGNQAVKNSTRNLQNSSSKIQNALGNDSWTNMVYDLLIDKIGSELGSTEANKIVQQLNDPKFVESLVLDQLIGGNASKYDKTNAKEFAKRLSGINDKKIYNDLYTRAATNNASRSSNVQGFISDKHAYGMNTSFIKDDPSMDAEYIKKKYGRNDISDTSSISTRSSSKRLTGVSYTNKALYEIFRRLDTGINVFQVGSNNSKSGPYKRFGDRHLKKPMGQDSVNVESTADESGQGVISGIGHGGDKDNLLRNNTDQDGITENLSKGKRFARWGKDKGKGLLNAMLNGDPGEVKAVFTDAVRDISGIAGDSIKKGISSINDKFGNVTGYLGHKMFGSEYKYKDNGKEITVGKNEKGGVFGFVTNKVKSMFEVGKEKGNKWFSEVAGYFDYGDSNKDENGQVKNKRKKLLHASVGAMAGAGLIGGPLGVIMGALAGNALGSIPSIGEKLKDKLFGKDKETGKPTGLLNRAADAIISPIQYQFGKTMSFVGDKLKKNLLGPLSDLGYVLKERISSGVSSVFSKFFGKMLDVGAKALGGIAKLGGKLFGGIVGAKGAEIRTKFGIGSGIAGMGINALTGILAHGTPGLSDKLKERRNSRNESIEENSEKYGSYKEWRKNKWLANKDNDDLSELKKYTEEQVISTKEIEDSNSEIVTNTGRTVELLTDIKNSVSGGALGASSNAMGLPDGDVSSVSGSTDNVISFQDFKNRKESVKEDNSEYGENLIVAGTTAAALGGFGDSEIKDIEDTSNAANRGESKDTIFSKFKGLMKKNKDKAEQDKADAEKSSDSFISKLIGGVGSLVSKYWPYILGGLALFSDKFREILFDVGGWLLDKLPSALSGLFNVGKDINTHIEANAFDANVVKDEVTGENKAVVSAESHLEHIQDGAIRSGFASTFDIPRLAKQQLLVTGGRALGRTGANLISGVGRALIGAGNVSNLAARAGSAISGAASYVSSYGLKGSGTALVELFKQSTSNVGRSLMTGGNAVSSIGNFGKNVFSTAKQNLVKTFTDPKQALANGTTMMAGVAAGVGHDTMWNAMDTWKNANIVGDYGMGQNAGGYVMTNTTVKTTSSFVTSMGASIAAGAILKAAGVVGASAAASASTGVGAPVALVLAIIAGALVIGAAIGALVNWITGIVTDAADKDYAIRSNASKIQGAIDGRITYINGRENPTYVYCGRESDRVLGLTKGMNIADPEIVFGRYFHTIIDGLTTSPGAEVLLYDWINNMAVQGVPFACYVAGDSDEASADGKQANSRTTGDPPTDRSGPLGGQYTRVRKSTVVRNKEMVFSDIAENINRQNPEFGWSIEDLEIIYQGGKEVVEGLKSKGILDNKGKVKTSTLKGSPLKKKPASGWQGLQELCRSNNLYFLTKCLVYLNSKIEANKEGQQWLEYRKDDLADLFETVMDVIKNENAELVNELKSQGLSDEEVEETLKELADPKGPKAEEGAELSYDEDPSISSISTDIKPQDIPEVRKEIQYLAAGYAYSHPDYLYAWVANNRDRTPIGVDDVSNIRNWDTYTNDKRKKKTLRSNMRTAALEYGKQAGDIFNLLPQFDWSSEGKLYGKNSKKVDKYGAAFVLRGQEKKDGEGILDEIFEGNKDYTPDEVHDEMYGRITHGKGAEAESVSDQDMTVGGNGVIARIADKMSKYFSNEGFQLGQGESNQFWRNVLVNIPARRPPNLQDIEGIYVDGTSVGNVGNRSINNALKTTRKTVGSNTDGVGGPVDANLSTAALDGGGDSSGDEEAASIQDVGGNPLVNKPFRITSGFGTSANRPHSGVHNGVDLVPSDGSGQAEVGSRFNGTILDVKRDVPDSVRAKKVNGSWTFPYSKNLSTGNMVSIKTDDGMIIKNMHLKAGSIPSNIQPGMRINAGDRLGTMGSTGWSTGNHLHYEFRNASNQAIDPTDSLAGSSTWNANASTPTYNDDATNYSESSSTISTETTEDSGQGPLGILLNQLKELGNQFLYKLTNGLVGSDSESSTTVSESSYNSYSSSIGNATYLTGNSNNKWITIVRDVKRLVAEQRPKYDQSGYINITYDGKTLRVRTDCTGIICTMLKFYGAMSDNESLNSNRMLSADAIKNGFDQVNFPGWESLVEGDILVRNGHAEVFAKNEGSVHYVYNGGNTEALCTAGATKSSHKSYTKIWRCREEVVTTSTVADPTSIDGSNTDSVYKKLKQLGYSDAAASGVMGTWQAESKNDSRTVEGDYLKSYPGYNSVMANNQSMNSYTTGVLFPAYERSNLSIKKQAYQGEDGNYYPGIGLAQWTGPRHYKLKKHADDHNKDWRDMDTQVEYMDMEKASRGLGDDFKAIEDPSSAAEIFARKFEGTSKSSSLEKRRAYARALYEKYKSSDDDDSSTINTDPLSNTDGVGGPVEDEYGNVYSSDGSQSQISTSRYRQRQTYKRHSTQSSISRTSGVSNIGTVRQNDNIPTSNNYTSSPDNSEIMSLLRDVLVELKSITGNTGNSNTLLKSIGENGIIDKGLRDQLSSIKPRNSSTGSSTSRGPNGTSNNRMIASMVRP